MVSREEHKSERENERECTRSGEKGDLEMRLSLEKTSQPNDKNHHKSQNKL